MKIPSPIPKRRSRIVIIPLIDIMFFLLASFMMVSLQMSRTANIRVDLPSATQAQQVSPQVVEAIAAKAREVNPGIVDAVSSFYAKNPQLVKAIGAGAYLGDASSRSRSSAAPSLANRRVSKSSPAERPI